MFILLKLINLLGMRIINVSILVCLFVFLMKSINGTEEFLFGFCFGVSYLCGIYFADWLCSYIYCKTKNDEVTKDLNKLFEKQEFLSKNNSF